MRCSKKGNSISSNWLFLKNIQLSSYVSYSVYLCVDRIQFTCLHRAARGQPQGLKLHILCCVGHRSTEHTEEFTGAERRMRRLQRSSRCVHVQYVRMCVCVSSLCVCLQCVCVCVCVCAVAARKARRSSGFAQRWQCVLLTSDYKREGVVGVGEMEEVKWSGEKGGIQWENIEKKRVCVCECVLLTELQVVYH